MKLGADVLLEIVSIVQDGLANGVDISQKLRELDLDIEQRSRIGDLDMSILFLSKHYRDNVQKR